MSPDDAAQVGAPMGYPLQGPAHPVPHLSEISCGAGHTLAISDGKSVRPLAARITQTVQLGCPVSHCRGETTWHAPRRRGRR